jgi:hypothetical protein
MRKYRNALLAGAAAFALVAGTGLASAQEQSHGHSPQATQPTKGEHPGTQSERRGGSPQSAQNERPAVQPNGKGETRGGTPNATGGENPEHNAGQNPSEHHAGQNPGEHNGGQNPSEHNAGQNPREHNAGQKPEHPTTGAQNPSADGHPSAANERPTQSEHAKVRLSEQQRTRIHRTIIESHNAPHVDHVEFKVNIGTEIPRHEYREIHVVAVPSYLVEIEPRWRGLEYFVFEDEIVIVDPNDLRIVAIVPA